MKPVLISVDIDRSAAEVFAFLDDVTNNTTWLKGMRSCTWSSRSSRAIPRASTG